MLTLAVDTTAEFGSIALLDDRHVRDEILIRAPDGFSGILFGQIGALLVRNALRITDIDLFAGASGPGSFTGVRIGLAAIKGLGEVMGKPVAAVSSLEALALCGEGELRAAVIDARRGEVYAGLFDQAGTAVMSEVVIPFPRLLDRLREREFEWVVTDFDPFRDAVAGTRFSDFPVVIAPRALAGVIGRVARSRGGRDPLLIEANYVRRSDAELLWKG